MKACGLLLAMWLARSVAHADDAATVDCWYDALSRADGKALSELMASHATVALEDIGLMQTRDEFVDTMDEWKAAIAGGSIRHKQDSIAGPELTYRVCYAFANNALLTRETFKLDEGLIVSSVQKGLADNCDGY